MSGQLRLDMRDHDLPLSWDGCPVEWDEWRESADVIMCPPPKDRRLCECGSTKPRLHANGTRTVPFADNVVRIRKARMAARERRDRLVAMRCPDCLHDVVWDLALDQWWDLDDSDYLDAGSYEVTS